MNNNENKSIIGSILGIGILVGSGALGHSYFFSNKDIAKLESYINDLQHKNYNLQNENKNLSKRYSIEMEYYLINSCVDKKNRNSYSYKKEQFEEECFKSLKNIENNIKEDSLIKRDLDRYF